VLPSGAGDNGTVLAVNGFDFRLSQLVETGAFKPESGNGPGPD
jgi:hypothetical protein